MCNVFDSMSFGQVQGQHKRKLNKEKLEVPFLHKDWVWPDVVNQFGLRSVVQFKSHCQEMHESCICHILRWKLLETIIWHKDSLWPENTFWP